jgi:hypothetical protein
MKGNIMQNHKFDRQAFNVRFDELIASVHGAEKITKPALAEISRIVLVQIHFDGDIRPLNRVLDVLTPMNRKAAVLFFQHFSGFQYSEKDGYFGKKDKPNYEAKYHAAEKELEDESFNIWTWAEREIKMEAKPFDLGKVTAFIQNSLKKAEKNGFSQQDVVKAVLLGGVSTDDIMAVLAEMVPENQERIAA